MASAEINPIPTQFSPPWVDVTESLPSISDWLLNRSEKLLVATEEAQDGITFAYCSIDDEDGPIWHTACANAFELHKVTHYAPRPALP
jgi:hypothetical protein